MRHPFSRCLIGSALLLAILGSLYGCAHLTPTIPQSPSATKIFIPSVTLSISTPAPESTATRTPTPKPRTLTICQGAEPDTLYVNSTNMLAANNVLEAIYDGPIDSNGFSYQPVILEKLPSLADGDASIQPMAVKENDFVVNDAGEVVLLRPGQVIRPYGCNLSDCAITWQGGALEMAQMTASFTLKQNIRWSDGDPLSADDSVFGFEKASSIISG